MRRSPRLLSAGNLSVPQSVAGIGNFFSLPRYPSGTRSRAAYNQQRMADLVLASRILVNEGVLDSFGHVAVRSLRDSTHYSMPRAMPPALVTYAHAYAPLGQVLLKTRLGHLPHPAVIPVNGNTIMPPVGGRAAPRSRGA